jgi:hypothetical protein
MANIPKRYPKLIHPMNFFFTRLPEPFTFFPSRAEFSAKWDEKPTHMSAP